MYIYLSLCLQHIVSVLSCSGGSALPLHLAAHIYPGAPTLHVRYRLHPNPLYSGPAFQLSASTQRAAHRRGKVSFPRTNSFQKSNRKLHHCPAAVPSGAGGRPWQQPLPATGRYRFYCNKISFTCIVTLTDVMQMHFLCSVLSIFTSVSLPPQLDDEDSILPHKLQAALEHVLDKRRELACEKGDVPDGNSAQLVFCNT